METFFYFGVNLSVLCAKISDSINKASKIFGAWGLKTQTAQPYRKLAVVCLLMLFPHPLQNRVPRVRILLPLPSCGYKKDIRSKNRAAARFFDARKPGFRKCKNVDDKTAFWLSGRNRTLTQQNKAKREGQWRKSAGPFATEIHSRSLEFSPKQATGFFHFQREGASND